MDDLIAGLLSPFETERLALPNRIVMAPMTRYFSPGGVPGPDVARYYARRAAAGVGFVITEGIFVPHRAAGFCSAIPKFGGAAASAGWRAVVDAVHAQGAKIAAQLWHVGSQEVPGSEEGHDDEHVSASGLAGPGRAKGKALSLAEIGEIVEAFAVAAADARDAGFDAAELHGGHGYLIDSFFWAETNRRKDEYGGSAANRARFAAEIVRACKRKAGEDFPVILRFSQWKNADYDARIARTPGELGELLAPLVEAGVDMFDCSTRRFWEPEFAGDELGLAGWTRRITGKPVITVGSVGLTADLFTSLGEDVTALSGNLDRLGRMFERGDFDLVAVGRMLLTNPDWVERVTRGEHDSLKPFARSCLDGLD